MRSQPQIAPWGRPLPVFPQPVVPDFCSPSIVDVFACQSLVLRGRGIESRYSPILFTSPLPLPFIHHHLLRGSMLGQVTILKSSPAAPSRSIYLLPSRSRVREQTEPALWGTKLPALLPRLTAFTRAILCFQTCLGRKATSNSVKLQPSLLPHHPGRISPPPFLFFRCSTFVEALEFLVLPSLPSHILLIVLRFLPPTSPSPLLSPP